MDWLAPLLDARDAEGAWVYPRDKVRDLVAVMLLEVGFEPGALTPEAAALLADFGRRVGLDGTAPREATILAVRDYLAEHPLDAGLMRDIRRRAREVMISGAPGLCSAALLKYVDGAHASWTSREPPPDGAVRGGPLSGFLAHKKLAAER